MAAIAAIVTGGSFLTGGTASASTLIADTCNGATTGGMGDQVVISGKAMHRLVEAGVNESGSFLANGGWAANDLDKVDKIPLGQIPDGPNGTISGDAIGTAVSTALQNTKTWWLGFDPNKAIRNVKAKVAGSCGLTVLANNYVPPTSSKPGNTPGSTAPGVRLPGSGLPGSLPIGGTGYAAPRDYSNIPVATPGIALPPGARYPSAGAVPAQSPEFGILGQSNPGGQAQVQNAGDAQALTPQENTDAVQLPMLLAVVALAGATAALVRTWVLRKL